jgi:hypothetical protein
MKGHCGINANRIKSPNCEQKIPERNQCKAAHRDDASPLNFACIAPSSSRKKARANTQPRRCKAVDAVAANWKWTTW